MRDGGAYDLDARELSGIAGCDSDQLRALVGHLARAGVLRPAPATPDRVRGRLLGPLDGAALTSWIEQGDGHGSTSRVVS